VNITEANSLNVVLRYLLGLRTDAEQNIDDQDLYDNAREHAAGLVERANKTLGAGLRREDIEDAWERLGASS
jgi:hypothetical protein